MLKITEGMTREQKWAFHDAQLRAAFWKEASRHERIAEICKDAERYDKAQRARSANGFRVWRKSMARGLEALSRAIVEDRVPMLEIAKMEFIARQAANPLVQVVKNAADAEMLALEKRFEEFDPGPTPEPNWESVGTETFKGEAVTVMKHRGRPGQILYVDREGEFFGEQARRRPGTGNGRPRTRGDQQ
jgi:hypothetical protein